MKKPRNKKYNPRLKNLQRVLFSLKRKSFVHTSLDPDVICLHNKRPQLYLLDNFTVATLAKERFKWSTFMAVFCKDVDGKVYMKAESCFIEEPLTQNEVADYLSAQHSKLIKGANRNQFYGYGWLSCPFEHDWTEEEAFNLFAHTGITDPDQLAKEPANESTTSRLEKNVA